MKALVLIDVQNDFMPGGALEVPHGDLIVPVLNRVQPYFDLVTATQDWHPKNHVSFASNHPGMKPFDRMNMKGFDQVLWPDHCVQGTPGAQFHPALDTDKIAAIFRKGMNPEVDSYSGFNDNMHIVSTGLSGYLREKGITELYVCGLAADICVYYTIRDAVAEGFKSVLIEDGSRPLDDEAFGPVKSELRRMGVKIINSSQIINPA